MSVVGTWVTSWRRSVRVSSLTRALRAYSALVVGQSSLLLSSVYCFGYFNACKHVSATAVSRNSRFLHPFCKWFFYHFLNFAIHFSLWFFSYICLQQFEDSTYVFQILSNLIYVFDNFLGKLCNVTLNIVLSMNTWGCITIIGIRLSTLEKRHYCKALRL